MFKAAVVAAFLLMVGYALYLATDTLVWFAAEAAALALLSVRVCGGLLALVVLVACAWLLIRQAHERNRQRDGAWALREYWLDPLPRRVLNWLAGRPSARAILDMNANMSHAAIVHNAVYVVEPSAGWDRQLEYMREVERSNRTRAAAPGDGVLSLPWASVGRGIGGVANAATGRLLAGAYDPKPRPMTIDAPSLPQLPPPAELTPQEAAQQSKPAELVLGQADDGERVAWDMTQTPHLRVHGMTRGAGKTGTIQLLAAEALHTGAHVVVFDPARLKDWGAFAHCAELVDTSDPAALADGAARLMTIYHNRSRRLAQAGAGDIAQMSSPPQRIVVVIAEFGAQCELARADGDIAAIETPLLQLARKAAATGIHLLLEDQVVDKWPRGMAGNTAPVIGRMPLYAAQACGFVPRRGLTTDTFERGQFWFGGRLLRVPHVQPALRELLADVPAPQQLVMLTPAWKGREEGSRSTVPDDAGGGVLGRSTPENAGMERNTGTPQEDAPGRWDDVVAAWFAAHPQALTGPALGISDLARAMCRDNEGGSEANYEAYKGRAHPLFHAFRASIRLPNGDRFGTDTTSIPGGSVVQ